MKKRAKKKRALQANVTLILLALLAPASAMAGELYLDPNIGLGIAPYNNFGVGLGYRAFPAFSAELGVGLSGARTRTVGNPVVLVLKHQVGTHFRAMAGTSTFFGSGVRDVVYAKEIRELDDDPTGCNGSASCDGDRVTRTRRANWSFTYAHVGVGFSWKARGGHIYTDFGLASCMLAHVNAQAAPGDAAYGEVEGIQIDYSSALGQAVVEKGDTGVFVRIGWELELFD